MKVSTIGGGPQVGKTPQGDDKEKALTAGERERRAVREALMEGLRQQREDAAQLAGRARLDGWGPPSPPLGLNQAQEDSMFELPSGGTGYDPTKDLEKIARVQSIPQVRAIIASLKAQIQRMKSLAAANSDNTEYKRMIAAMKRVLKKAETKVRNLKKEEQMESRIRQAEAAKQWDHAQELSQALKKGRGARISREIADILDPQFILEGQAQAAGAYALPDFDAATGAAAMEDAASASIPALNATV